MLGARGVGKVFVVGEPASLGRILEPLQAEFAGRLEVVPEGRDILENCLRAFFLHLLPGRGLAGSEGLATDLSSIGAFQRQHPEAKELGALVVTSDLPFIAAEDIEQFLDQAPDGAAIVAGLCDHAELDRMQLALGSQTVLDQWKLGAIPLRSREVRWNNLFLARPLVADPVMYTLLKELYTHRWLLGQDGKVLWRNWLAILRAFARYSVRVRGRFRFFRGLFNFTGMMFSMVMARLVRRANDWIAKPFRMFLGRRDLEFTASLLVGAPALTALCKNVAPAIDIDVEESYRALVADGGENYLRVARYLGRLTATDISEQDRPGLKVIAGGKS